MPLKLTDEIKLLPRLTYQPKPSANPLYTSVSVSCLVPTSHFHRTYSTFYLRQAPLLYSLSCSRSHRYHPPFLHPSRRSLSTRSQLPLASSFSLPVSKRRASQWKWIRLNASKPQRPTPDIVSYHSTFLAFIGQGPFQPWPRPYILHWKLCNPLAFRDITCELFISWTNKSLKSNKLQFYTIGYAC